jgi:hypothetical protein
VSDCGVCIGGDVEGVCDFYAASVVKARKPHRCCECGRSITPGTNYKYVSGKYEGEFFTCKTCLPCDEILRVFSCGGSVMHECLWEDMRDYVFDQLTTANECFRKLSPPAKEFLLIKWQQWKGLGK